MNKATREAKENSLQTPLEAYEEKTDEIKKVLRMIDSSLMIHDRHCSTELEGHGWAAYWELDKVKNDLDAILAFMNKTVRE